MTTSGVYTLSVARDNIIRDAMLNIGALDGTEQPEAQEVTDCAFKLNLLVKQLQGNTDFSPGLKTWTRKTGYQFLSRSTGQYSMGPGGTGWTTDSFVKTTLSANAASGQPVINVTSSTGMTAGDKIGVQLSSGSLQWTTIANGGVSGNAVTLSANLTSAVGSGGVVYDFTNTATEPLFIESALLRDQNNEDTPLRMFGSRQDWDAIPGKTDTTNISDPGAIFYEWHLTNGILYTDVGASADVTKYMVLTYMEEVQIFSAPTDTPYYPAEWFRTLSWALSKEIAPMFHRPWTKNHDDNYNEAIAIGKRKSPEITTMYFQAGEDP